MSLAIINAFASLERVYQIGSPDIDALVEEPPYRLAQATGASEVLLTTVHEDSVAIARHAANGECLWQGTLELTNGDMATVVGLVFDRVSEAYADRPRRGGFRRRTASATDYRAFLELRKGLDERENLFLPDVLDQLREIRKSSPALLDAYYLEVSVASYLFRTERNDSYIERAQDALRAARKIAPDNPRRALAAADLAFATNDLPAATEAVEELVVAEPFHPSACRYRARLAELNGRLDDAIDILQGQCNPRASVVNLRVLADLEMRAGRKESARRHLVTATEMAPGDIVLKAKLGEFELRYGDPARARDIYREVVPRLPRPYYLSNRGTAELLLGDYEEALIAYQQAIDLGSNAPGALLNLADAFFLQGNEHKAKKLYQKVLDQTSNPRRPDELAIRAYCRSRCGELDKALEDIASATSEEPDSADIAYLASLVHLAAGDTASGCREAQRASELGMNRAWFELPWFEGIQHCIQ